MGAPQYEQAGADIGGSGTTNTIPRWTGASTLGDSIIVQNAGGTAIAIGDAAGVSYVGLVQVKRAGGAGWLTLDHTGGSYAEVQSYNVPLYLNRQGNNTILNATSGNVGIGTASPAARIHSVAADGTYQLALAGTTKGIRFQTTAAQSQIDGVDSTLVGSYQPLAINGSTLGFLIGGVTKAGINGSSQLYVSTNGTAASPVICESTGVSGMYFPSAQTVAITANGSIAATFSKVAGAGVALGGTTGLVFDASGTQQGIKLPSASAASFSTNPNTLDCYEEGTWTPTLANFVTNTPGTVTATYTRIGRMVTLNVYLYAGGSSFGSTLGTTTVTVPSGMTPNFVGVGIGGLSRTTGTVAQAIAYYDGKIYLGTTASAATEMWVSVTYYV